MKKKQVTPKLQAPPFDATLLARGRELIDDRDELLDLQQKSQSELAAAEGRISHARATLSDAEVASQLNGHEPTLSAQKLLKQAEADRERLRALLKGIDARLAKQEAALGEIAAAMATAQSEWANVAWQSFLSNEYRPALKLFRQTLVRAKRITLALGFPYALPLPEDMAMADSEPLPEYVAPWQARQRLDKFVRDIGVQRRQLVRYEGFDARYTNIAVTGSYRFRTTSMVGGVRYEQGAVVTEDTLHPGLLRRLIAARSVVPVIAGGRT